MAGVSPGNVQDLLHQQMYGIGDPGTALANIFLDSGFSLSNPTVRNSLQSLAPALVNSFLVRGAQGKINPSDDASWDVLFRDYASNLMRSGNLLKEVRGSYNSFRNPMFGGILRKPFNDLAGAPGVAAPAGGSAAAVGGVAPGTAATVPGATGAASTGASTGGRTITGRTTTTPDGRVVPLDANSPARPTGAYGSYLGTSQPSTIAAGRSGTGAMLGSDKWDEPDELDDMEEQRLREQGYSLEGGRYVYRGMPGNPSVPGSSVAAAPAAAAPTAPAAPTGQAAGQPFVANPTSAATAQPSAQPQSQPNVPVQVPGKVVSGQQNPFVSILMDMLSDPAALGNFQYTLAAPWMGNRAASSQRDLTALNAIEAQRRGYGGPGGDFFSALFGG